jgi:hypothetical protein
MKRKRFGTGNIGTGNKRNPTKIKKRKVESTESQDLYKNVYNKHIKVNKTEQERFTITRNLTLEINDFHPKIVNMSPKIKTLFKKIAKEYVGFIVSETMERHGKVSPSYLKKTIRVLSQNDFLLEKERKKIT